ncbi:T9SS type A sorting domain-containing protein [Antarcticibacterium sp. 1MA-6-2]|uniref:T9SS type A sorting domain-containing protein n=1 Tax=Antarcticibacterium sp. 1MA-6-2 TaxID=2908210 RepID=UPI001F15AD94|nr:T9SS type A sorting domain-containing protein [Antarcticibacterium sp. 1MA-6-2]UJH91733.1 T9SS type A sorting domain-containing protein [Antarcticibacterium sp. 1MA-6-2]
MAAYPNPTTNYFKIEASTYLGQSLKYHLTDLHGNFIEEGRILDPGAIVDVSGLAVAVYLLHITNGSERIKTFKIIKK